MKKRCVQVGLGLVSLLFVVKSFALEFALPKYPNDIVGEPQLVTVGLQNRVDISQKYDIGFYELVEANPGVNLDKLSPSQQLLIPTSYILPAAPHKGVVINLAEMRLYYYVPGHREVFTFPVGIGKQGWATPLGKTHITAKAENPDWKPTPSVRADFLSKYGYPLPEVVPAGPDNPLGDYAMRLAWRSYLIHGTNDPNGVGKRVSAGCVRMFDSDIQQLYLHTMIGTPVRVVYQPYKAGWKGKTLYLEAHLSIPGRGKPSYRAVVKAAAKQQKGKVVINWQRAGNIAKMGLGVPQPIGYVS